MHRSSGYKGKAKKPRNTSGYVAGTKGGKHGTVHGTGRKAPPTDAVSTRPSQNRPGRQTTPAREAPSRKRRARERKRTVGKLRSILHSAPPAPTTIIQRAKEGRTIPDVPKPYEKGYHKALTRAYEQQAKHNKENLGEPEDITHAIEAGAALATGASLLKAAVKGGEEIATRAAEKKGTESIASKLGSKAEKKIAKKVDDIKTAPKRTVRKVKEAPKKAKAAPRKTKEALSTKEGRRAVAKGTGKAAAKRPVKTGVPLAAASPVPLPGELDKRARAFLKGTADAAIQHPKETLETTGKGFLGALTAPLAVTGAGVESVKEGSPKPLGKELKTLGEGLVHTTKNLASGNEKKVEKAVLTEAGLIPLIPVPHIARRVKGTKAYEETRGALRGRVEGRRGKVRNKRIEAEKAAQESGQFVSKKQAKKVRHSVEDTTRPGEHYIFRRAGKLKEKQRSRHYVAREVTRMEEEGKLAGKRRSEEVARPLRKSKGTNQKEQNFGEALRIVVKHGLPKDEAKGLAFVEKIKEQYAKGEHGATPPGVHLDRHSVQFILDHPDIFKDKHFWRAVERFDEQAKGVGTSARNQYLAQVHNVINPTLKEEGKTRILAPEEMIPAKAVKMLPKQREPWTRKDAWDYMRAREDQLKELRAEGKFGPAKKLEREQKALYRQLKGLMRPAEHGGPRHGVTTTRTKPYTDDMLRAFTRAAKREGNRMGLREPAAYVADVVPSSLKGSEKAPDFGAQLPVKALKASQGKAARSGNAESSFESLVFNSIEAPRAHKAFVKGLNRIFDRASRKVAGRRYLTASQLEKAINTHQVPDGVIPVRTQALRSLLEGDEPVTPEMFRREFLGEIEHGQKLIAGEELAGEVAAAKELKVKGEKYAPMDQAMIRELMGHMKGIGGASVAVGHATNFATRTILNSPAFELSQFAQEGIPGAAALGRDIVNVPKAITALRKIDQLPAEDQAMIRAVVGSSVGVLGAPNLKALRSEGFMNPIRAAGKTPAWRRAWELVNGDLLSRFDRARAGRFREVAALAKIEGDFRRAEKGFRVWRTSANNLFKGMEQATKEMRGMSREERLTYVASHPKLADRLTKSMSGMMGNWNSFTVFEKHLAPFTIFYPFQRYSVLWMLYHFPLDHPVVATGLAMLGEVNAQELEKIAAKKGASPNVLDYTKPVVNGNVLPAGQRFFPALGSIQQAAVEGKPSQAIQSLSPALSIPIEAITGKNAFTGAPIGENGWLYILRQSANLSPLARFLGLPDVGKDKSAAAKLFESYDPLRSQRSLFNPYIGQSGKDFAGEKKLERKFEEKYGEGDIPSAMDSPLVQKLLFGGKNGGAEPKLLPKVIARIHKQERASNFIKRKEAKYLPHSNRDFTDKQKELLSAVENAWQTGPNAEPKEKKSGNPYIEAFESSSSKGNPYLEAIEGSKSKGNPYLEALK